MLWLDSGINPMPRHARTFRASPLLAVVTSVQLHTAAKLGPAATDARMRRLVNRHPGVIGRRPLGVAAATVSTNNQVQYRLLEEWRARRDSNS
jgi:hypothetical protein